MQNMCFIIVLINSQYFNNIHANKKLVRIGPYTKALQFLTANLWLTIDQSESSITESLLPFVIAPYWNPNTNTALLLTLLIN